MKYYSSILRRLTDKSIKIQESVAEKAKAFDSYDKKLHDLKSKLTDEYKLWSLKKDKHKNRYEDVERDINTIKRMLNSSAQSKDLTPVEKSTIDKLCKKYSLR